MHCEFYRTTRSLKSARLKQVNQDKRKRKKMFIKSSKSYWLTLKVWRFSLSQIKEPRLDSRFKIHMLVKNKPAVFKEQRFIFSLPHITSSLFLIQVRSFSAVICATPPSLQRGAWRCTCASTLAPSPSSVPSANSASELRVTAKHTSSVTSVQTATAANPSVLPRPPVRPDRVKTQRLGRVWLQVRGSSQLDQRLFSLWGCCKHPALTPAFTSQLIRFSQGSLTRIYCSQD